MRFYVVEWYEDGQPENIGYQFFKNRREAEHQVAELHRFARQPTKCYCGHPIKWNRKCRDCHFQHDSEDWCHLPPKIKEVEFKGTPKEMVFKALCYQVV